MNVIHKLFATIFLIPVLSVPAIANAALVSRDLDGNLTTAEAYYDNVADLTWLANTNINGGMNWVNANTWAAGLNINGYTGWRLPSTVQPDATCDSQNVDGQDYGNNCTGSEMGNLYHTVLGNGSGIGALVNTGPFSNLHGSIYWSATEYAPDTLTHAWRFSTDYGFQGVSGKSSGLYAWAVQTGDIGAAVSTVPVPAAIWLFGSGFVGLIALTRRKKA